MDEKIFEKFSESARFVLISAQQLAETMNSPIGSEHILLALVLNRGTFANEILKQYDINFDQIKLVMSLHNLQTEPAEGKINSDGQNLLMSAIKLAADFGHISVDSEHLLLAMVTNREHLAFDIVERIGVNPAHLQKEIESLFDEIAEVDRIMKKEDKNPKKPEESEVKAKSKTKTPALDYFTVDLTAKALQKELDPVIGREAEISRAIQILSRRTKNNPILIGEPGVGKTAIAEGLAQRIVEGHVPLDLLGKRLISLDLTLLVAGTMYRGQFEDRVKKILDEIRSANDIILFIDEIHTIIGAGSAEGSLDAANILKPALAKGWIRLVGATTNEEYRKHIKKDTAFERRLQPIQVEEPSVEETVLILQGLRTHYEEHHGVTISDQALEAAARLSARYVADRFLPDKAIDLIDEASAATRIARQPQDAATSMSKKIALLNRQKDQAVTEENYQLASHHKEEIDRLILAIESLKKQQDPTKRPVIDEETIARLVSLNTGVPLTNLISEEKLRYNNLDTILKEHIIGQDEAVAKVTAAIKRSRTGISDPNKPIGSFIFLGPTGVGKTELARVLAKEVFGSEKSLVKIDMSDFMERHNTSRLVGAPAGYVGYEDGGKLTEAVRRRPYSVVLFDEIEKAHPDVFNMLLQVLDEGQLVDAKGLSVSFKNTIIIMTSNLGMAELTRQAAIGFGAASGDQAAIAAQRYEEIKNNLTKTLKDHFRPEFLNRLDGVIVFQPLGKEQIGQIIHKELKQLSERVKQLGYELEVEAKAVEQLATIGYDPANGARSLRRTIVEHIEGPLSDHLLAKDLRPGSTITIAYKKDNLRLSARKRRLKKEMA